MPVGGWEGGGTAAETALNTGRRWARVVSQGRLNGPLAATCGVGPEQAGGRKVGENMLLKHKNKDKAIPQSNSAADSPRCLTAFTPPFLRGEANDYTRLVFEKSQPSSEFQSEVELRARE